MRIPEELLRADALRQTDPVAGERAALAAGTEEAPPRVRCWALLIAASAAWSATGSERALVYLRRAHRLDRDCNLGLRFEILLRLAGIERERGDLRSAKALYATALALADQGREPGQHGRVLNLMGILAHQEGQPDSAARLHEAALGILPRHCRLDRASAWTQLATIWRERGDYRGADVRLACALASLGSEAAGIAGSKVLWLRADLCAELQNWQDAMDWYDRAAILLPVEALMDQALLGRDRARAAAALGDPDCVRGRVRKAARALIGVKHVAPAVKAAVFSDLVSLFRASLVLTTARETYSTGSMTGP